MKKICIVLCLCLAALLVLPGCAGEKQLTRVRLSEVTHSVFYAPQYVAMSQGFFRQEGLEVELTNGGGADKVMTAVVSGQADMGLAGPEAAIYVMNQGKEDHPVIFAQLTKRDGSFLVGREPGPFSWEDVRGRTIIGGRAGGVPEMTLEYVLRQRGIEPQRDAVVDTSVQFNMMAGAFTGGNGDYVTLFEPTATEVELGDPNLDGLIGERLHRQLADEIELLDGASCDFDLDRVRHGKLSPVFFGSALTNFGVEPFLEHFLQMTTAPLPRRAGELVVDSLDDDFSAFVFKIQANMNKAHRDRIAFMRIVSGRFDADKEVYHVQGGKKLRLSRPQQLMAAEREIIEEAYAGDIIGVFDPGIFSIGDTLCAPGKKFRFDPIPTFAPEHFKRVRSLDTM